MLPSPQLAVLPPPTWAPAEPPARLLYVMLSAEGLLCKYTSRPLGAVFPQKTLLVIVTEAPSQQYIAPPSCPALFPVTVQLLILKEESVYEPCIAPQNRAAVFRAMRQRVNVRELFSDPMPPLHLPDVLSITSQSIIVRAELSQHITAPPLIPAEFSNILQRVRTSSDRLPQNIPPPFPSTPLVVPDAELPLMRQPVMVRDELSQHDIPPPASGAEFSLMVQPISVGEAPEVGFNPPPISSDRAGDNGRRGAHAHNSSAPHSSGSRQGIRKPGAFASGKRETLQNRRGGLVILEDHDTGALGIGRRPHPNGRLIRTGLRTNRDGFASKRDRYSDNILAGCYQHYISVIRCVDSRLYRIEVTVCS